MRRETWLPALRAILGVAGLALLAWIVARIGVTELAAVLWPALPWLPLAAALDLVRIACDGLAGRLVLGAAGRTTPLVRFLAAQWVGFAVMAVAPAGRAAAEATKASLLTPFLGAGRAVAMGAGNQAATLIAAGAFSVLNAGAAAALTGGSVLTWLLVVHAASMIAIGVGFRWLTRHERAAAWLRRRVPALDVSVSAFAESSRDTGLVPISATLAMMVGRAFQAAHYGVLLAAVGASFDTLRILALHGVHFVVAFIAVLVPGQVGASEGATLLVAGDLGLTETQAAGVALLARGVQLALSAGGFLVLVLWRSRAAAEPATADEA